MMKKFLPISIEDIKERGWDRPDFVFVTGDAYVDHPSFGVAIISRVLESFGYKVAILAQPNWKDTEDIQKFGEPRLGFLVTAGNIDSMVNHYTVAKKKRTNDAYTPGGEAGKRPDHATVVYCNLIRQVYKDTPIIIGGIEASLRRMAHYDYWSDSVKRSILLDSQADLLLYGMGEKSIVEVAEALSSGISVQDITYIAGTVYKTSSLESLYDYIVLPTYNDIKGDKKKFANSFKIQYENTDFATGKVLVEGYGDKLFVVQNTAQNPLTQPELDNVYALDYMRDYHPIYEEQGGIAAIEEVKYSLISNRGCFGGCNFCALTFHQGRVLQSRSHKSIVTEAEQFIWDKDFKGYIHDVGGPTANFRHTSCEKQMESGVCKNKQCLFPEPCKNLKVDHSDYLKLLTELRGLSNVKKVFVRSGIRFDYLIQDKDDRFFNELCKHHISGQLKVAPEHVSNKVLNHMGKPEHKVYERFVKKYKQINDTLGMKQFLVPYLMSSHPGSDLNCAIELALYLRDIGHIPQQVQDFYPTPSTISTCMYYTERDPLTMQKIYVPKSSHDKAMQRALIQYKNPKNYHLVHEALTKAGREDLIGFDKKCLIRPQTGGRGKFNASNAAQGSSFKKNDEPVIHYKKRTIRNVHKKKS
ncbi:MAG: YgiQ family radical SAM protein [Firmicutes bacterium HGW-Firmicutes-1]|nr:MAG: YgiQ family radical SAM protein [Firmicutes bacterium HGW-Firmicutes-1]